MDWLTLALEALIWIAGAVGIALVGLLIVRRAVPHHVLRVHNDVAGFVYATIAVTYAVLLAFMTISVWERFDEANVNAEREANALADLYRLSGWFSESNQAAVRAALLDFASSAVDHEWPAMEEQAAPHPETSARLQAVWDLYVSIADTSDGEGAAYDDSLEQLQELGNHRRERILQSNSGMPGVMWVAIVLGGALTVAFAYGFGVERGLTHAVMIGVLAASVGLLLFLVWSLNHPFGGNVAIDPDGYRLVIEQFVV
jgi:hypothetical protein